MSVFPHIIIYKDRKYLLVNINRLNFAIVKRNTYIKRFNLQESLINYYPTLQGALEALIRLRARHELLQLVRYNGAYSSFEVLVKAYPELTLNEAGEVRETVQTSEQG